MKRFLWALAALPSSFSPINSSRRSGSSQKRHWFVFTAQSLLLLATGLDLLARPTNCPTPVWRSFLSLDFICARFGRLFIFHSWR